MLTTGTPTPLKLQLKRGAGFVKVRSLHHFWACRGADLLPTLFLWGRALQSNPRHWPTNLELEGWLVQPTTIEGWRQELCVTHNGSKEKIWAPAAGTAPESTRRFKSKTAHRSLTSSKDVLALCRWLRCLSTTGSFLELGTSLGVTAAYVAQSDGASKHGRVASRPCRRPVMDGSTWP